MSSMPEDVSVVGFDNIRDAALVQDHLEVPYGKDQVKGAPQIDPEVSLSAEACTWVFRPTARAPR